MDIHIWMGSFSLPQSLAEKILLENNCLSPTLSLAFIYKYLANQFQI